MDFNYTLKYRTFDQLLEDVTIDFNTFALENMIEPQQLIKLAKKINYELGLRLNQTKEVLLEVRHGKVKLPDDFYTFNFAFICGEYQVAVGYNVGGTHIAEIPYHEFPAKTTLNCCEAPIDQPCCFEGKEGICITHNPEQPYGDVCTPPRVVTPRVFMNCKDEAYELIQIVNSGETRKYKTLIPLRMKASQEIDCNCPNLYFNTLNEGWIKYGFLHTTFKDGTVYLNYQGTMEDENGNLLVPDHDLLNEYYEYAFKQRILENLLMNGEDVSQRIQIIETRVRAARNNAISLVNTPNFKEMEKMWWTNRKAMYSKYYDMFKSHAPASPFYNQPFWRSRII